MDVARFVEDMEVQGEVTRRRLIELAGLAGAGGLLLRGASPAIAAPQATGLRAESVRLPLGATGSAVAAGGWTTSPVLRAPRRVSLAGIAWDAGRGPAAAAIRARRSGGEWTRWLHLHADTSHAPDGEEARRATDPAWLGKAEELQVRVRGRLEGLHVHAIRVDGKAPPRARTAQTAAPFPITPRAAWGGDAVPPRSAPS